jgi:hypothetical protein
MSLPRNCWVHGEIEDHEKVEKVEVVVNTKLRSARRVPIEDELTLGDVWVY